MQNVNAVLLKGKMYKRVIVDKHGWEKKWQTDYCKNCVFLENYPIADSSCYIHLLGVHCDVRYCGYYTTMDRGV